MQSISKGKIRGKKMKIEKNIAFPMNYAEIAREMEDGDSVLCESKNKACLLGQGIRNLLSKDYKPVTRKQKDGIQYRVWKLKKK
ncbi:MAG TPA: hypothetical protein DCS66_06660 [Flavobacteriaceae bacterium]|nr:hypothetical protein [Flavobacteriaceae bacterium]